MELGFRGSCRVFRPVRAPWMRREEKTLPCAGGVDECEV